MVEYPRCRAPHSPVLIPEAFVNHNRAPLYPRKLILKLIIIEIYLFMFHSDIILSNLRNYSNHIVTS